MKSEGIPALKTNNTELVRFKVKGNPQNSVFDPEYRQVLQQYRFQDPRSSGAFSPTLNRHSRFINTPVELVCYKIDIRITHFSYG